MNTCIRSAPGLVLLTALVCAGLALGQEPLVDTAPDPGAICPAIALDYELCAANPMSGNCPGFVSAAAALGRLYLFNVERQPEHAGFYRTQIWWQCGTRNLAEIAALLRRIDSPPARSALAAEPYRSIAAPDAPAPFGGPSAPVDCNAGATQADRSACEARELAAAQAAHRRAYAACESALPEFLRGQLAAREGSWQTTLKIECSDARCETASIRERDDAMRKAFPQCGGAGPSPEPGEGVPHPAKTGMLPARWTPPRSETPQPVPFSFEAQSETEGTLSTTLGDGGEQFHGSYVLVEKSTEGHLVTAVYDGWSSPEWEMWGHDADGGWTATGVSFGDFAHFYTGKVLATLQGNRGDSLRCQFRLTQPASGLSGGGAGTCQVSNGGRLSLDF